MKRLLCIFLFLITCSIQAQTVSFSPTSAPLWGQIEQTAKLSAEYKDISLIMVYPLQIPYDTSNRTIDFERFKGVFFGMFYTPINYKYKSLFFSSGVGLWNRKFPTSIGQRLYFTFELDYKISRNISLFYSHLSNGFAICNQQNPGLDSIGMKIHL